MVETAWQTPEALARRYGPAVFRLAYARTASRADAEDVMQEVFLRLLRARPEFSSEEHAKAWLLHVAANCANDLFRAPWRRREEPLAEGLSAPEEPERGGVVEAVLALPPRHSSLLWPKHGAGRGGVRGAGAVHCGRRAHCLAGSPESTGCVCPSSRPCGGEPHRAGR